MSFLRSLALFPILLLCVPVTYDSLVQAQSTSVLTNANVTFTTVDVPGADFTGVVGINTAGDMVGDYGQSTNGEAHGFLYTNGVFTYFDYPGQTVTEPSGINDAGLIVGSAGQNPVVGFLYDGTTFTPIQHGHDNATIALGINNASDVVGGTGTIYTTKAFELRSGRFRDISPPGTYIYIYATGINNFGKIVGWTDDDGFAYDGGKFKRIAFPGANQTEAWGINDKGVIVGWYASSECICAFALRTGRYLSFRYPGAAGTLAYGINNLGQVVGGYTFDYETWHGFVTSPITAGDFASSACCQGAAAKRNQ